MVNPWQNWLRFSPTSKWEFLKVSCWSLALTFYQVRYLYTYFVISFFTLSYQQYFLKCQYILVPLGYAEYQVLWAFVKIYFLISTLLGTHYRPWYQNVSSYWITNPTFWLSCMFFLNFCNCGPYYYITFISSATVGFTVKIIKHPCTLTTCVLNSQRPS